MTDFDVAREACEPYTCAMCGSVMAWPGAALALDRMEAENERLRERADNHRFLSDKYDEHVGELEAEVERLREALKTIADKGRYGCCNPIYPALPECPHNIARSALDPRCPDLPGHETHMPPCGFTGLPDIYSVPDLARLRRIEEAARAFVGQPGVRLSPPFEQAWLALRSALEEKQ